MEPDRERLLRNLTAMAAEVVKAGQTELALAWLWSCKADEPLPGVSRGLLRVLEFVSDHRYSEVEPGYRGSDYFEDCLQLAMRSSRFMDFRRHQLLENRPQ
ncbi:MAG TPA: hypothetical protein VF460_10830 [Burkholderiales bacterium]|jgi:hypothetical protein